MALPSVRPKDSSRRSSASEQVRRALLRQTTRLETNVLPVEFDSAISHRYSLAESSCLAAGAREFSALTFCDKTVKSPLTPNVDAYRLDLFNKNSRTVTELAVYDGLPKAPDVNACGTLARGDIALGAVNLKLSASNSSNRAELIIGVCASGETNLELKVEAPKEVAVKFTSPATTRAHSKDEFCGSRRVHLVPDSVQTRVPFIKRRENGPISDSGAAHVHWMSEKKLLAASVGENVKASEIQIIGIFRQVPLSAARRIEIGPGPGELSLYFRVTKGKVVQSASQRLYSIVFGRVRGQKDIIRVLIPE